MKLIAVNDEGHKLYDNDGIATIVEDDDTWELEQSVDSVLIKGGWRDPLPTLHELSDDEVKKITITRGSSWKIIHSVADRMVSRLRRAFMDAVALAARKAGTLLEVERAVRSGDVGQVLQALNIRTVQNDLGQRLAGGEFTEALRDTYTQTGRHIMPSVLQQIGKQRRVGMELRFDIVSPRSIEFLRGYSGSLITEVTAEMQRSIIAVTNRAFESGGHPYAQAKQIRALPNFGLTTRQNMAVWNFRDSLTEAGVTGAKIDRQVDRYRFKLLKYRSENIARTETIRAAEAGHHEAWKQAGDAGLFNTNTARRHWVVTPDDRLCDSCEAIPGLNPDGVAMEEEFQTNESPRLRPPLHPSCRCSIVLKFGDALPD